MRDLIGHMDTCLLEEACDYPKCSTMKNLIKHFDECLSESCVICYEFKFHKEDENELARVTRLLKDICSKPDCAFCVQVKSVAKCKMELKAKNNEGK